MLATVVVARSLVVVVLPLLDHFRVLCALEGVQEQATEAVIEVVAQAFDKFFEKIGIGGASGTPPTLDSVVVGENDIDRLLRRQGDEKKVLCDVLPVVDEDRLEEVGKRNADFWTGVVGIFLLSWSERMMIEGARWQKCPILSGAYLVEIFLPTLAAGGWKAVLTIVTCVRAVI